MIFSSAEQYWIAIVCFLHREHVLEDSVRKSFAVLRYWGIQTVVHYKKKFR